MNLKTALLVPAAVYLLILQGCTTVSLAKFERGLTSEAGIEGEIHGANRQRSLYVFTYRNPNDFFDFIEVSMIASNAEISFAMAQARRHDRVRIKGRLLDNRSPQPHVELMSFEIVKPYAPTTEAPAYDYEARIPEDLTGKDSALFLVHAVHAGGEILVVEYQDAVLPVYALRPELTRRLARNDVVRLSYEIQSRPDQPMHLQLLEDAGQPIEVVESVMALHGKDALLEGALVLFPASPQVRFNVFAVLQELPGGLKRQYTLASFESAEVFAKIRDKLQQAWDGAPDSVISGRNKLINTEVRIRARGKFNEVDPNQANVQILLEGPESVEILDRQD